MVVRYIIGAVVHRLPYSEKIPVSVMSILEETPKQVQQPGSVMAEPDLRPAEKIRSRIMKNRAAAGLQSSSSSTKMDSFVDADDGVDSDDSADLRMPYSDQELDPMTEKYLDEQNEEFNSLINRNLKEVVRQQDSYKENLGWRRLVIELALARNSSEVTSKLNVLVDKFSDTVYSYIPFIHSEEHHTPASLEVPGSRNKVLDILDDMDYDSKMVMLKQLSIDLGLGSNTKEDVTNFTRNMSLSEDATMLDKFELLCLLSVRLSFICLKFFFPICQLLYEKFKNDEIILVNNKNFSNLLSLLIRVMEGFEKKLAVKNHKHEVVI